MSHLTYQERRGQIVQRPVALNIAQKHGGFRWRRQGRQPGLHMVPVLVNVADEYDAHAPRC